MENGTKAKVQLVGGEQPPAPQAAKPQFEREQSPLRSFSQIPEIYGANSMEFLPDGVRSSSPTCPARQCGLYGVISGRSLAGYLTSLHLRKS